MATPVTIRNHQHTEANHSCLIILEMQRIWSETVTGLILSIFGKYLIISHFMYFLSFFMGGCPPKPDTPPSSQQTLHKGWNKQNIFRENLSHFCFIVDHDQMINLMNLLQCQLLTLFILLCVPQCHRPFSRHLSFYPA